MCECVYVCVLVFLLGGQVFCLVVLFICLFVSQFDAIWLVVGGSADFDCSARRIPVAYLQGN